MEEYKQWLESKIDETDEFLGYSLDIKRYGDAFLYSVKNDVYKECLAELEKEDKQDKVVSFDNIEVGEKYNFTSKDNDFSEVTTIIAKGYDNKGKYVWYSFENSPNVSFKVYEDEYYFEEVQ